MATGVDIASVLRGYGFAILAASLAALAGCAGDAPPQAPDAAQHAPADPAAGTVEAPVPGVADHRQAGTLAGAGPAAGWEGELDLRASDPLDHHLEIPLDCPAPARSEPPVPSPRNPCAPGFADLGPPGPEDYGHGRRDRYLQVYSTEVLADVEMNLRADSRAFLQWVMPLSE